MVASKSHFAIVFASQIRVIYENPHFCFLYDHFISSGRHVLAPECRGRMLLFQPAEPTVET